jgi:hypothetical protein
MYIQEKKLEEMGGMCGTCGRLASEYGFSVEDLCVDGRILLKTSSRSDMRGIDWIDLVLDRNRWLALVKTVMNLWVP